MVTSRPTAGSIPTERIISMGELQKLSLRKLRELRLSEMPLVVMDLKQHRRRFVILDHESFRRLHEPAFAPTGFSDLDFAAHGLLWDRPAMTNERFAAILGDPGDPDHHWAWGRVLERLPSRLVTRAVGLSTLRALVSAVRLRPRMRAAWEGAIEFWTAEARRRLA